MLATHVVGDVEHVAERRPPQHEFGPGRVGELEREVGVSAGDQREIVRSDRTVDVVVDPGGDASDVDTVQGFS